MPNLKDLRSRKKSVLATRKITSAMKMIAAAKLKRAHHAVNTARPYADLMVDMLTDLLEKGDSLKESQPLLYGTGKKQTHLFIIATSNRGLCGGFNSTIVRHAKRLIEAEKTYGKTIQIMCWGTRGKDQMRREYDGYIIETFQAVDTPHFKDAARFSRHIYDLFKNGAFDECTIVYNHFISALNQDVLSHRLIPFYQAKKMNFREEISEKEDESVKASSYYEYEPSKDHVLADLLPKNLSVQIFRVLLENAASEQGARMTAMDSATRNADDMIKALDLKYNRTRQATITKELIEIISGAEAL